MPTSAPSAIEEIGVQEASALTGFPVRRIKRAIITEELPARKSGKYYRIRISDLNEFAKEEGPPMTETAAPSDQAEGTGDVEHSAPPTGNGIAIEGTAPISSTAPAIVPAEQPEGNGNAVLSEGRVIWDGSWDTLDDALAGYEPAVTKARARVKETNATHQEAINERNRVESDALAIIYAATERMKVQAGIIDGAQPSLQDGE